MEVKGFDRGDVFSMRTIVARSITRLSTSNGATVWWSTENTNPQGVGDFPKKLSSAYTSIIRGIGEMTPTELLIEARKLIEAPERWCQAQFAYTVDDRPTHAADITACNGAWTVRFIRSLLRGAFLQRFAMSAGNGLRLP